MKVASVQPRYPHTPQEMSQTVEWLLDTLDACDASMDLIVLPEACNAMSAYACKEDFYRDIESYTECIVNKARETAERCQSLVAVNLYIKKETGFRNTTQVYDRSGHLAGEYFKQQLPISEIEKGLDRSYAMVYQPPYTLDIEGIRLGFLTCYDCYYNEFIQHIALRRPDIVIVSSLQRGETMNMLEVEMKNAAFNCNAFVIRSSVSMGGADYTNGANSMVVSPEGEKLCGLGQQVGILTCEIEPHHKHRRSFTYGREMVNNEIFVEYGRTPWAYRACGPSVCPDDVQMPYPRVGAPGGYGAPEGTLPAFAASVALGAQEIVVDVAFNRDGEIYVVPCALAEKIGGMCREEIQSLDISGAYAADYAGISPAPLAMLLKQLARQVVMQLRVHLPEGDSHAEEQICRLADLIYDYDMFEHVYIAGEDHVLGAAYCAAPELPRAAMDDIGAAMRFECRKIIFTHGTQVAIEEAHSHGLRCIVCVEDAQDIQAAWGMDVDVVLSGQLLPALRLLVDWKGELA